MSHHHHHLISSKSGAATSTIMSSGSTGTGHHMVVDPGPGQVTTGGGGQQQQQQQNTDVVSQTANRIVVGDDSPRMDTGGEHQSPSHHHVIASGHHLQQQHHRSNSGQEQYSMIGTPPPPQIIQTHHQVVYSLSDHIDDDNDVFECGKCKQHFSYLNVFLQHKKMCNSRKTTSSVTSEKLRELAEIELHLGIASSSTSQQHLVHHSGAGGHPALVGKSLLSSSSANSSPLLIPSTNNSPTSMLTVPGTGGAPGNQVLGVDLTPRHHHHHHHHHQNRSSPLVDPLNGSAINVNSILPDNDLLSLASSLDANMIASIGNSISPSSLLHLQGGDVSSNTDDFAQFAHLKYIDPSNESPITAEMHHHHHQHQVQQPRVMTATGTGTQATLYSSNGTGVVQSPSTPITVNTQQQHHQNAGPQNTLSFINSIHTSPTSFASFIQNLQTTEVPGGTGSGSGVPSSLLKTPFDRDESASNETSIGSPSRFLNLPPPSTSSAPPTPTSIIEHRPNQGATSSVRSTQTSNSSSAENSNIQQHTSSSQSSSEKTITAVNVIHPPQQKISGQQPILHINHQTKPTPLSQQQQQHNESAIVDQQQQQSNTFSAIEPFHCNFCDRSYSKSSDLANHLPCHTGEKPYQCCVCGKAFGQKSNLRKHIPTHKMGKEQNRSAFRTSVEQSVKNMPPILIESASDPSEQTGDQMISKEKKSESEPPAAAGVVPPQQQQQPTTTVIYICPMKCGVTSDSLEKLKVHCASDHQTQFPENATVVTAASAAANSSENVNIVQNDGGSTPFIAPSQPNNEQIPIDPSTMLKINLETQDSIKYIPNSTGQTVMHENKPLTTTASNPTLVKAQQSAPVRLAELEEESFKIQDTFTCPVQGCGFVSSRETEFKMHCVDHTMAQDENIKYRCTANDCQEVYENVESYIKHLQSHDKAMMMMLVNSESEQSGSNETKSTKTRLYRCQTCLNRYSTQNALENHRATTSHHYPCKHCNKVFPCERYLRRHMLTHGAGLYVCKYCDKTFKTANYLKVHLIIHTGEKPFACKICDAAFNRRDKLKRHELVHDPVKRYKCPMNGTGCKREFNRPDKLKAHILTHSGVKPYQCQLCPRSFTRRAHLREHCKTHQEGEIGSHVLKVTSTDKKSNSLTDDTKMVTHRAERSNSTNSQTTMSTEELQQLIRDTIKVEETTTATNNQTVMTTTTSTCSSYVFTDDHHIHQGRLPEEASSSIGDSSQTVGKNPVPVPPPSLLDKNGEGIILFTRTTATAGSQEPQTTQTTSSAAAAASSSSSSKSSTDVTTPANTTATGTAKSSTFQTFILLYTCAKCDTCFFKEDEFKTHKCLNNKLPGQHPPPPPQPNEIRNEQQVVRLPGNLIPVTACTSTSSISSKSSQPISRPIIVTSGTGASAESRNEASAAAIAQ